MTLSSILILILYWGDTNGKQYLESHSLLDRHVREVFVPASLVSVGQAAARDVSQDPAFRMFQGIFPGFSYWIIYIVRDEGKERFVIRINDFAGIKPFVSPMHAYDANIVRVSLNRISCGFPWGIIEG